MRRSMASRTLIFAVLAALAGCKIVMDPDPEAADAVPQTDEARMEAYAAEVWEPQVLPVIAENLVPLAELRPMLAADADGAANAHGMRRGQTGPWNFAVSGEGTIVDAKLESRAAEISVDTDGDGEGDVSVQLGPIIRGTALRDSMPFISFTDFRDQIEFAKLANGLNAQAHATLEVPQADVIGKTARFEGVFTLSGDGSSIDLVPTALEVEG